MFVDLLTFSLSKPLENEQTEPRRNIVCSKQKQYASAGLFALRQDSLTCGAIFVDLFILSLSRSLENGHTGPSETMSLAHHASCL